MGISTKLTYKVVKDPENFIQELLNKMIQRGILPKSKKNVKIANNNCGCYLSSNHHLPKYMYIGVNSDKNGDHAFLRFWENENIECRKREIEKRRIFLSENAEKIKSILGNKATYRCLTTVKNFSAKKDDPLKGFLVSFPNRMSSNEIKDDLEILSNVLRGIRTNNFSSSIKGMRSVVGAPFEELTGEEIVGELDKHYEGKQITVRVNRYERDRTAKQDMIDAYRSEIVPKNGYKCQVCGFDFEDTYGDLGRNFIEAHHLTPLSEIKENHEVNPATDMIPLCANCHAMIHKMKNPNYEELRDLYQKRCYEKKRLNAARKASKVISAKNFDYIPFHLKNLYELFKKEQNIHNRSRIAQEAHEFMRYLSKDAVKEKWMKEILKEFS